MATNRILQTTIEITMNPFPLGAGDRAGILVSAEWAPDGRTGDVRPSIEDVFATQGVGDPLADEIMRLQSRAETFIENQLAQRGRDLTDTVVDAVRITWSYANPLQAGFTGLGITIGATWRPSSRPGFRPQFEGVQRRLNDGQIAETADILAISNAAVAFLSNRFSARGDTLSEGR